VDESGGQLAAAPVYLDAGLLYYRKDLLPLAGFSEPPSNWSQLITSAEKVQARMRETDPMFQGFVWQGAQYEGLVVNFLEFAGAEGGLLLSDRRLRISQSANQQALAQMHDLVWTDRISPLNTYTEMHEEEARNYFQSGHALYERNWPYAWALHESPESPVRGKVGVALLPGPDSGRRVSVLGGYHAGVSRFSRIPQSATRFVAYITSRAVQKKLTLRLGWNPGREDLYDDPEVLAKNPHFALLKDALAHSLVRPQIPYYMQVSEQIQPSLNAAVAGTQTPEQALKSAQAAMERLQYRYGDAR
jgi:multiple sugar transport system substrate-binding protein